MAVAVEEQALMQQVEISEKRVKVRGMVVLTVEERRYSTYFLARYAFHNHLAICYTFFLPP